MSRVPRCSGAHAECSVPVALLFPDASVPAPAMWPSPACSHGRARVSRPVFVAAKLARPPGSPPPRLPRWGREGDRPICVPLYLWICVPGARLTPVPASASSECEGGGCAVSSLIPNASPTCPPVCSPCPISQGREGPSGPKPDSQAGRVPVRSISFLISESYHLCPEQGGAWDHLSVLAWVPPSVLAPSDREILGPKGDVTPWVPLGLSQESVGPGLHVPLDDLGSS